LRWPIKQTNTASKEVASQSGWDRDVLSADRDPPWRFSLVSHPPPPGGGQFPDGFRSRV